MKCASQLIASFLLCAMSLPGMAQPVTPGPDVILIRATAKTPDQVVEAIKAYAKSQKWLFMGANTVKPKPGAVTMVKVCVPKVAAILWPVGLQVSAFLPCGNLGVYRGEGKTQVSMLHPGYMQILYPHPNVEKAVALATPLLTAMLEAITK